MIMVHDGDVDDDDDEDGDELAGRQAATETDRQTGRRVAPVGAVWYQRLKLKHTRELHRFFMPDLTRLYTTMTMLITIMSMLNGMIMVHEQHHKHKQIP